MRGNEQNKQSETVWENENKSELKKSSSFSPSKRDIYIYIYIQQANSSQSTHKWVAYCKFLYQCTVSKIKVSFLANIKFEVYEIDFKFLYKKAYSLIWVYFCSTWNVQKIETNS
jgi:hypothetical protein